MSTASNTTSREPWNRGRILGQKAPFKLNDVYALRVRPQIERRVRELALFNFGSTAGCEDPTSLPSTSESVCHGDQKASRAIVMQQ